MGDGLRRIAPVPATSVETVSSPGARLDVHPSPARVGDSVRMRWSGTGGTGAKLTIRDVAGRVVRTFSAERGAGEVRWDGRTNDGDVVSAGTYFARVDVLGDEAASAKIVLLR
jgi:hypothetical protein